jgi:hypothetical protein
MKVIEIRREKDKIRKDKNNCGIRLKGISHYGIIWEIYDWNFFGRQIATKP